MARPYHKGEASAIRRAATIERNRKRAAPMAALYKEGKTLQEIGDIYGVTREYIRQCLRWYAGVSAEEGGAATMRERRRQAAKARRDATYLRKYGCAFAHYKELRAIGKKMMADGFCRERTPIGAYRSQKSNARRRGIGWELTLWQWWTIWRESGHWHERGRGQGYVMCREGDTGPYAVGNVFIANARDNNSKTKQKKHDLPMGVRSARGKFTAQRMINGRVVYLGTFDHPDLAHAAYLSAAPLTAGAAQ